MHDGPVKSVKNFQQVEAINGNSPNKSWNQHKAVIQTQNLPCMVSILEMWKFCWLAYVTCLKAKEDLTQQMILHRSNIKIWENIAEEHAVKAFAKVQAVCRRDKKAVYHLLVVGVEEATRFKGEAVLFTVLKKLLLRKVLMKLQFIALMLATNEWL